MENHNGLTVNKTHQNGLVTSTEADPLMKIIYHVNQVRNFPLTVIEIAEWSRTLRQNFPELDLGALAWLVNEMKMGRIEFDHWQGVRNLTIGLAMVEKTSNGYQLKSTKQWPG